MKRLWSAHLSHYCCCGCFPQCLLSDSQMMVSLWSIYLEFVIELYVVFMTWACLLLWHYIYWWRNLLASFVPIPWRHDQEHAPVIGEWLFLQRTCLQILYCIPGSIHIFIREFACQFCAYTLETWPGVCPGHRWVTFSSEDLLANFVLYFRK